jgi:hypothetical protein
MKKTMVSQALEKNKKRKKVAMERTPSLKKRGIGKITKILREGDAKEPKLPMIAFNTTIPTNIGVRDTKITQTWHLFQLDLGEKLVRVIDIINGTEEEAKDCVEFLDYLQKQLKFFYNMDFNGCYGVCQLETFLSEKTMNLSDVKLVKENWNIVTDNLVRSNSTKEVWEKKRFMDILTMESYAPKYGMGIANFMRFWMDKSGFLKHGTSLSEYLIHISPKNCCCPDPFDSPFVVLLTTPVLPSKKKKNKLPLPLQPRC